MVVTENSNVTYVYDLRLLASPLRSCLSTHLVMKRSGIVVRCSAVLGAVVLFHRDDDIALFVSRFDIPVSFDNLFQRIASINDWF